MTLKIYLLGQFKLQAEHLPVELPSRPAQSTLAYLALNAGVSQRREKLSSMLWPGANESNARAYLRQALWRIHKSFNNAYLNWEEFLRIDDISVKFISRSKYWLDANSLLSPLETGSVEQYIEIVELYKGELLPGFYDEWVVFERDRLQAAYHQKMSPLVEILIQNAQWENVLYWGERWIQLAHAPETAYRALMSAYAGLGDMVMVSATYQRCQEALQRELSLEPSLETRQLYDQIIRGELELYKPPSHPTVKTSVQMPAFLDEGGIHPTEPPLFIARERELEKLDDHLELALANQGRVVFITGEAGSGKTALINAFTRRAQENHADLVVASGSSNAYTGVGDPYLPFREVLEMLSGDVESRWTAGAISTQHARRVWNILPLTARALVECGPDLVGSFVSGPALLQRVNASIPGDKNLHDSLQELAERQSGGSFPLRSLQDELNDQYCRFLCRLANAKPLLIVLDDLQWADLGSASLFFHLGRSIARCRILVLGAYRPEEVALVRDGIRHPLVQVLNELGRIFGDISINLDNIDGDDFIDSFLASEPNELNPDFQYMLKRQTRGHPLFTIELLRGMQERGDLVRDQDGKWIESLTLDWEKIPARVEAVIAERVGRLAQPLQEILKVASVEGETFTAEVVADVLGQEERTVVQRLSSELERTHNLVQVHAIKVLGSQHMSRYRFKHYLCQKYVYDSLDAVEKNYLHKDVGGAIERICVNQEGVSSAFTPQLARHFQEANIPEKAVHYLHLAGKKALQLSAYQDSLVHLQRALGLLLVMPDSPRRAQQELEVQISLGMVWMGIGGSISPEREIALTRARQLCMESGDTYNLCRVLHELGTTYFVRAEYLKAQQLAEEMLVHAKKTDDPILVSLGHFLIGMVLLFLGKFCASHEHLREVIDVYHPDQHQRFLSVRGSDAGVVSLAYDACCLWFLGYPDQALDCSQQAISMARELSHPFSLADTICHAGCWFNSIRRDAYALKNNAEEMERLSIEKGLFWRGPAAWFKGEALGMMGQYDEAIELMQQNLVDRQSSKDRCYILGTLGNLAKALAESGKPDAGLKTLEEAFRIVQETGESNWQAELYRLQAELMSMQGDDAGAEICLNNAINSARRQSARSWELRAATDLAKLWEKQGRFKEAKIMLGEIYGWFTEGFDTPDLLKAKALLDELG